eukprot:Skav215516  [mRNA]  locus=scaffold3760:68022:73471:+ [translate_table: standard]
MSRRSRGGDREVTVTFEDRTACAAARSAVVPAHLELPVQRMNQFWAEADRDRSQLISFEEFLLFFYRYFRLNTPSLCPFQEYYRGIRRVRVAYPEESSRTDGSGRAASKPASKTTRS